jgi:hypothetical protein
MGGCAWVLTFEPFLAKCAAVRRLRVIEGMMREYQGRKRQEYAGTNEGKRQRDILRKTEIFPYLAKQWHVMWRNRWRWSSGLKAGSWAGGVRARQPKSASGESSLTIRGS